MNCKGRGGNHFNFRKGECSLVSLNNYEFSSEFIFLSEQLWKYRLASNKRKTLNKNLPVTNVGSLTLELE